MSLARRRQLVDGEHPSLSITRQCALLGVSRSGLYYRPKGVSREDLALMQAMDRQYLETPFYGSRRMKAWLVRQGVSSKPEAGATADAHHGATGPEYSKRILRLPRFRGVEVLYPSSVLTVLGRSKL